jgi:hypothetical protein
VAIGWDALNANTTGGYNTALGTGSLLSNTTASNNTAVGYQAGYSNTTGAAITAVGQNALRSSTTASNNVAVGQDSLYTLTTGTANVVVGTAAARGMTTGNYNTVMGQEALKTNTTASNNTAVGHQAGLDNTTGTNLAFFGKDSGTNNTTDTTGVGNTFIGRASGLLNTTGSYNTYIGNSTSAGYAAGYLMTTGTSNVIIGGYNGNQGGLDIRTSSNNIVLSDGDGNPRAVCNSSGAFVFSDTYTAPNDSSYPEFQQNSGSAQLGLRRLTTSAGTGYLGADASYILRVFDSSFGVKLQVDTSGNVTSSTGSYGTISDQRFKENIQNSGSQWDDIKAVQVKKYSMIEDALDAPNQIGVIAQDLEAAGMSGLVTTTDAPDVEGTGTTEIKTVKYSILYMKAVKALQEAMDRIETLEAKVTALENA